MYCTYCGRPNAAESKYCEGCGKPLTGFAQPPTPTPASADAAPAAPTRTGQPSPATAHAVVPATALRQRRLVLRRWIRRLAALGAIAVCVGFFRPWVMVSAPSAWGAPTVSSPGSSPMGMSGYVLALGEVGDIGGDEVPALANTVWLWAVPVLGLLGLLALNGRGLGAFASSAAGALGMIAMTAASLQILFANRDLAGTGFSVQLGQGYWIAWLGFTWLLIVPMVASGRKEEPPAPAGAVPTSGTA